MTPVSWVGDVVDTLPKTHISPAKLPSQKGKDRLSTCHFFSGVMIVLGEGYLSLRIQRLLYLLTFGDVGSQTARLQNLGSDHDF